MTDGRGSLVAAQCSYSLTARAAAAAGGEAFRVTRYPLNINPERGSDCIRLVPKTRINKLNTS